MSERVARVIDRIWATPPDHWDPVGHARHRQLVDLLAELPGSEGGDRILDDIAAATRALHDATGHSGLSTSLDDMAEEAGLPWTIELSNASRWVRDHTATLEYVIRQ